MKYGLGEIGEGSGSYQPSFIQGKKPQTENTILRNAVKALKEKYPHAIVVKIHGGEYQQAGIPDLYIGLQSKSVWVEFKRPGADTTRLQYHFMKKLQDQGIWVATAESKETLLKIVEDMLNF